MSLEQRIIDRWKEWWTDRAFELREKHMRELIAIALEEAQEGRHEPSFTNQELIHVHNMVSVLKAATNPGFPASAEGRIPILRNLVTPEVLSAIDKIESHLNDQVQTQGKTTGFNREDPSIREISETHKNCPICQKPIPVSRKYCSIKCSNKAQGRKSAEVRKRNGEDSNEN